MVVANYNKAKHYYELTVVSPCICRVTRNQDGGSNQYNISVNMTIYHQETKVIAPKSTYAYAYCPSLQYSTKSVQKLV